MRKLHISRLFLEKVLLFKGFWGVVKILKKSTKQFSESCFRSIFDRGANQAPKEYGWRFPGPKIGKFCKNWQFLLFIGSDFLLEIQFLAIFGQYSFQQYFFGSLAKERKRAQKSAKECKRASKGAKEHPLCEKVQTTRFKTTRLF